MLPLLSLLTDLSEHPSPLKSTSNTHLGVCADPTTQSISYDNYDFELDWGAIDHQQLSTTSARDGMLTSMASNLAAWLADGNNSLSSDDDGSDVAAEGGTIQQSIQVSHSHIISMLQHSISSRTSSAWSFSPNPTRGEHSQSTWFPWPDKQVLFLKSNLRHILS